MNNKFNIKKMISSLMVVAAPCFTFLLYGPFEIIITNQESIHFKLIQIFPILVIGFLIATIVIGTMIYFTKTKVFNFFVGLFLAITTCGYIQGNFGNTTLEPLTGFFTEWKKLEMEVFLNTVIWITLGSLVFYAYYKFKESKLCQKIIFAGCAMLILTQLGTMTILAILNDNNHVSNLAYLSNVGTVTLSDENIIIFVLDQFDYVDLECVIEEEPQFLDQLEGFVQYNNVVPRFTYTYPSLNYILTKGENALSLSREEYLNNSWKQFSPNLLESLNEAGYNTYLYSNLSYLFANEIPDEGVVNLKESSELQLNSKVAYKNTIFLSAYRYAPMILKKYFETTTDSFNYATLNYIDNDRYEIDETLIMKDIDNMNIVPGRQFKFYHFQGPHEPYYLNENGIKLSTETSRLEQTKGSLHIVIEYIKSMKKLGVYEDSTIIITADHGVKGGTEFLTKPLEKPSRITFFYKEKGNSLEPLIVSQKPLSQDNILPTIYKIIGSNYEMIGIPIDEVSENEQIIRKHSHYCDTNRVGGVIGEIPTIYEYEIVDHAKNFENWTLVEEKKLVK